MVSSRVGNSKQTRGFEAFGIARCVVLGVSRAVSFSSRSGQCEELKQIKQQIDAVKSDKSIPEAEKKEDLEQLYTALKSAKPIQFKENIALVRKYFDKLTELMQGQGPAD